MAYTQIADIVEPEVFTLYTDLLSKELSLLVQSGLARHDALLDQLIAGGGSFINMPFWNLLEGDEQVLDDVNPIVTNKITASKTIAVLQLRANAWAAHELASELAGANAFEAIGRKVARWMISQEEDNMLAILAGIFSNAAFAATHMLDISSGTGAAAAISAEALIDTRMLLGDAYRQFSALAVHPKTFGAMQKQNLIDSIPDARGEVNFNTYMGYPIIVEDRMPTDGTTYTSYLFANGSFARATGVGVGLTATEISRDTPMSTDILTRRFARILHPVGFSFSPTTTNPTNVQLSTGTNWTQVYPDKNIGIVALKHTIA